MPWYVKQKPDLTLERGRSSGQLQPIFVFVHQFLDGQPNENKMNAYFYK